MIIFGFHLFITALLAEDQDAGTSLEYFIVSDSDWFSIGSCSGQISVKQAGISQDPQAQYTLQVNVKDEGGLTPAAPITVIINIKNLNDPPEFDAAADTFIYHVSLCSVSLS